MARLMQRNSKPMKRYALGVLLALAFSTQAFAIIRSPFPAKPTAPGHGQFIVIGEDAIWQAAAKPPK
jgi:hypothetical protein